MSIALVPSPSLFKKNLEAIGFTLIGLTVFAFTDTICKWLTQDYSVSQVLCLTNIVSLLLSTAWIMTRHGPRSLVTEHFKLHILRGICVMSTAFLVVNAFSRIPLADFYGIAFLSPLVISLLSHFILKETIGWHRMAAIAVGFIGVIILAGPQFNTLNIGILFAFASVITISTNGLLVRKMRAETVMPLFAFYPALFNVIVNFPLMMGDFKMPEMADIPLFICVGPLIMIGLVAGSAGFSRASETAVVAPFHYTQILWGVGLGYLLFGDVPSLNTVIGIAIIISSGLYVIWREHRLHKATILPPEDLVA